jgi:hypothetical protein
MAKQTGMAWTTLSVDDSGGTVRDIRNDITNFQFATPRAVQDVTGVDKSAIERLLLLADFSITLNGVANFGAVPSATAHGVFATVPSTSVARTVTLAIGGKTLPNETLFTDYSFTRAQDGSLVWTAPGVLADGTIPLWA